MPELFREFTAARLRAEDEARSATFQAWQTARFYLQGRSKKGMPSLSDAMNEVGGAANARRPQSLVEAKAALETIAAQHGLRLRKVQV